MKFSYGIKEIARLIAADFLLFSNDLLINEIAFDSRKTPINATASLFFALKGNQRNGQLFIDEAYDKGIRCFVVSEKIATEKYIGANILVCKNSLAALQQLAAYHRKKLSTPILAITGSNGKTIIKEWLYHLLHANLYVTRSPKSFNSQLGVPLSLSLLHSASELGIIEAGISMPGEMQVLEQTIRPDYGILCHIGDAHQAHFLNAEHKLVEKLQLFKQVRVLIHKYDDWTNSIVNRELPNINTLTWGETEKADFFIQKMDFDKNKGTHIYFSFQKKEYHINIPFSNAAAIENAVYALAFMLYYQEGQFFNSENFSRLPNVSMRLELKAARFNSLLINDAYNSDLNAVGLALDFLSEQAGNRKKVLIISDIYQSFDEAVLYKKLGLMLSKASVDILIGIGENILARRKEFKSIENSQFYSSTQEFLSTFKITQLENSIILLKGARYFQFEKIAHLLENKHHSTRLEVSLSAMQSNLNTYRGLLQPETKIMVMVKAFSYGSGTLEIARMLEYQKVDYLAVAYATEGVDLKIAGIKLPIMVMNPSPEDFDQIIAYELMPEIYSLDLLKQFIEKLRENGLQSYPIHLKLDTGMSRLGFSTLEIDDLLLFLRKQMDVKIVSVFSHLASADDAQEDEFSKQQMSLFTQLSSRIEATLGYKLIKHIVNSTGIERFPEAHFDMVRLGIGLYGANTASRLPLQNISSLKTVISQIKFLKAGQTIGYNRKGVLKTDGRIATVPIGYADGLNRLLSNGVGELWINGQAAPIIGSICMDMTMVDVSSIEANVGDEVEIFGENQSVEKLAKLCNTISYEILTSISPRVKRLYFYE